MATKNKVGANPVAKFIYPEFAKIVKSTYCSLTNNPMQSVVEFLSVNSERIKTHRDPLSAT